MAHVLAALLAAQDATGIRDLIEAWRSEHADVRDKATADVLARWREWTDDDLRRLDEAGAGTDTEVASRARATIARLRVRRKVGARVLEKLPAVETAFTTGTERDRLAVLRNAGDLTAERALTAAEVAPVVELAAAAEWTEHAVDAVDAAEYYEALRPLLLVMFRHPSPGIRRLAVDELYDHQAEDIVRAAVALLRDADAGVRAAAVESLGRLDRFNFATEFVPLLADADVKVRLEAIKSVGRVGDARHAEALAPLLRDERPVVRAAAADALSTTGLRAHSAKLVPLLRDPDASVRAAALEALAYTDAREHAGAIAPLLRDPDLHVRKRALDALGDLGAVEYAPDVIALARDKNRDIRVGVVWAVCRMGSREHARVLEKMLDDPDSRWAATLWALAWVDGAAHRSVFVGCLKDQDANLRRTAAEALGRMRDAPSADLVAPLLTDENELVRAEAAAALRRLGCRDAAERLRPMLRDDDVARREQAIQLIVTMGAESLAPAIVPLLRDESVGVRTAAARALGRLRARDAVSALEPLLKDAEIGVRAAAIIALARLGAEAPEAREDDWSLRAAHGIAQTIRGRTDRARQRELLALLEPRWINDDDPFADDVFAALEARHEPGASGTLARDVALRSPVGTLDELRAALRTAGLRLVVESERDVRVWGRLPEGWRGTVDELLQEVHRGRNMRNVVEGDEVRPLTNRQALRRWMDRLK